MSTNILDLSVYALISVTYACIGITFFGYYREKFYSVHNTFFTRKYIPVLAMLFWPFAIIVHIMIVVCIACCNFGSSVYQSESRTDKVTRSHYPY